MCMSDMSVVITNYIVIKKYSSQFNSFENNASNAITTEFSVWGQNRDCQNETMHSGLPPSARKLSFEAEV